MTSNTGGNGRGPRKPRPTNRRSATDLLTLATLDGIPTTHASTKARIDTILKDETIEPRQYETSIGQQGLTPKQEGFASSVAQGMTLSAAYRANYSCQAMADGGVWTEASKLASHPKVAARIKALDDGLKPKAQHDPGEVKAKVLRTLTIILEDTEAKASDRMKAAELLGKWGEVGLFTEHSTIKVEATDPTEAIEALKVKLTKLAS